MKGEQEDLEQCADGAAKIERGNISSSSCQQPHRAAKQGLTMPGGGVCACVCEKERECVSQCVLFLLFISPKQELHVPGSTRGQWMCKAQLCLISRQAVS